MDAIAAEYGRGDAQRTARAAAYLRDNVKYGLGPDEAAGLQLFLNYAADLGLAPRRRQLEFFSVEMIDQIARKVSDGGRVDAAEALRAVSPRADASAGFAR